MTFPFNAYSVAFLGAICCTALSFPGWRRWCLRHGHVDHPGHRKIHQQPVALAGGLAVFTGISLPVLAGAFTLFGGWLTGPHEESLRGLLHLLDPSTSALFTYGYQRRALQLAVLGLGAVGMVVLGWLDDRHELRPGAKFAGQLLVAAGVAAAGVRITLFVEAPGFSYGITILWILTVTNACNFMDNMNGLCAGLGAIGAWCFAWNGALQGQFLVATVGFLTCGALLGFLPFNFPRAKAFLGDAGSHLVGYLLAVLAILPNFYSPETPTPLAVLKPLLVLGLILADLVAVVLLRWRLGQPFYVGDTNHFSHRLVRCGLPPTTAVLVLLLVAAALGALSFAL
jgi:UDP-GlcNAc:undecaprenyl-phosphate/decaprenyl-phosphate GlcNAc-1-phosphate transferase